MGREPPLVRMYRDSLIVGTTNAIVRGVAKATQELPSVVQGLGAALSTRALPEAKMLEINKRIALEAQRAVVSGYNSRLPRGASGGDLTGTLGSALADSSMTDGTSARVISFVNTRVLGQQAKHWYRINYGAMGPNLLRAGGHEPQSFAIEVDNKPFITLRDDLPPAKLSWLPRVYFWGAGNQFVATRGPAKPTGKGSRAAHFIDLGLGVVAEEFGPAYDQFFRDFVFDAKNRLRLERRNIHVIADVRLESYGYTVTIN